MNITALSAQELQLFQSLHQAVLDLLLPMTKPVQFLCQFCESLAIQKLVLRRQASGGWYIVDSFTQPSELLLQTECLQNYEFTVDDTTYQLTITTEAPFSIFQHRLTLDVGTAFCKVLRYHLEPRMLLAPVSRHLAAATVADKAKAVTDLDRTAMVGVCV